MQSNHSRRRSGNMRRKRRRTRQIWRRVCLAVAACILAGVITHAARAIMQTAELEELCAIEEAELIAGQKTDALLQAANISDEALAAVPREPDFVCLPVPMSEEEQRIIFDICTDNGVAFSLVMAIAGKESKFQKEARSATGDSGYMQINDCHAEELERKGYTDLFDTAQNVGAGVSILRDLFERYEGETHKVLMAYNMGERRASELWAQGIEASEYSREIVAREEEYSRYMDEYLKGN